jgi:hypothetical protein
MSPLEVTFLMFGVEDLPQAQSELTVHLTRMFLS